MPPKNPLWLSAQETFYRWKLIGKHKCLKYDILELSREQLKVEEYSCQWFSYLQLWERFKVDKKFMMLNTMWFLKQNSVQMTNVIAKMYNYLLKFETKTSQGMYDKVG